MSNLAGAVLITGSSTGIGHATALLLAQAGYAIYAGVRTEQDARRLNELHQNISALTIDVTDPASIAEAFSTIAARNVPLYALLNNAGIAVAGPLEFLPLQDFRRQFEVNVFGALYVTQAALPFLRTTRGRVLFMSSISGQIAPPMLGPYASSKFALEALADALRMELRPFGIFVTVIQPGNVHTPIWEKGRRGGEAIRERMPPEAMLHYGHVLKSLLRLSEREERNGVSPSVVAQSVLHALRAPKPKARYVVGSPPAWQRRIATLLPEAIRDRLLVRNVYGH